MAELTLRLEVNPATGKKNIIVSYESDADALPMEHEDEHKRLVDALIRRGVVSEGELGEVIVEREPAATTRESTSDSAAGSNGQASKLPVKEGG